jgi:hypothetical protein
MTDDPKNTVGLEDITEHRLKKWEKLGVDRVKADLLSGAYRVVGGTKEVRAQAWRWVRFQETEEKAREAAEREKAEATKVRSSVTVKAAPFGLGIEATVSTEGQVRPTRWLDWFRRSLDLLFSSLSR